jgi:hypothetical protein
MAKQKPVLIDGKLRTVAEDARIIDVVPEEVKTVVTRGGELISREDFARVPVPQGFETNLSRINKGARDAF